MRLSFAIALRFLKSSKGQTILISLGIAVGVSVQIFIGLLIQGLQTSLVNKTIGNSPQITVVPDIDGDAISNWEEMSEIISKTDKRIINISAVMDKSAIIRYEDKVEPVLVRGLELEKAEAVYGFKDKTYEGRFPAGNGEIIAGKELKEKLGLKIEDSVKVIASDGRESDLKVVGFYDLKVSGLNERWIITNLKSSQDFAGVGNEVSSIEMQVNEIFKADEIAGLIKESLKDTDVKAIDWKSQNQQLLSGLSGQSISSVMIQVFVLVSVVLAIASVLAISVMQKSKQIGILKAMGLKDKILSLIFLFEGLLLGVIGAVAGIFLGIALLFMFTKFAVNPDGTPVVDIYFNYGFIAASGIIAVLSAIIASLIPAGKSSKMDPIEVIKNG